MAPVIDATRELDAWLQCVLTSDTLSPGRIVAAFRKFDGVLQAGLASRVREAMAAISDQIIAAGAVPPLLRLLGSSALPVQHWASA
jgi:hypothetical protein